MRPHSGAVIALVLLIPTSGCDTVSHDLSSGWGPRSRFSFGSHRTDRHALDSFVKGVAANDVNMIWDAIGPELKERAGWGKIDKRLAWETIKEDVPGIHLVGQATESLPETVHPTATCEFALVRYRFTRAGTEISVDLREYPYWSVTTDLDDGAVGVLGEYTNNLGELVTINKLKNEDREIMIRIPTGGLHRLSELREAHVGIDWLIYRFSFVQN